MPNTTYGLPYPQPTDPVAEGAAAIQSLAEQVDAKVLAGPLGVANAIFADNGDPTQVTLGYKSWGVPAVIFGNAFDTYISRSAAQVLSTNGAFHASLDVHARSGSAAVVVLGDVMGYPGVLFGPAQDAYLYRVGFGAGAAIQSNVIMVAPDHTTTDGRYYVRCAPDWNVHPKILTGSWAGNLDGNAQGGVTFVEPFSSTPVIVVCNGDLAALDKAPAVVTYGPTGFTFAFPGAPGLAARCNWFAFGNQ